MLYNNFNFQLLTNDSITHTKKRQVIEADDEDNKPLKPKAMWEKWKPIKQVEKKSAQISVLISSFIGQVSLDIQTLLININIFIPALLLFQISSKFCKQKKRLMTISHKPCKKKVVLQKEKLYAKIQYFNKDIVDINYVFFQIPK